MLAQPKQGDQFALPATIIRVRDWQINPVPDDREFRMTPHEPQSRKAFQNEMSDMMHRHAPIDGLCLKSRDWRPRHLINTTPGMGKILDELAGLIEGTEEMAAEGPFWRPHGRKGNIMKLNASGIIR
jgi:hypothetical protein